MKYNILLIIYNNYYLQNMKHKILIKYFLYKKPEKNKNLIYKLNILLNLTYNHVEYINLINLIELILI